MPGRDEFETVFDQEAEASIKDLQFTPGEDEFEKRLKRTLLDIYSGTLDRRAARHAFARNHGLLQPGVLRSQLTTERSKRRDEEQREKSDLWNSVKPFARFVSKADLDAFYGGLVREADLKKRIATLQEYRRAGLTSLSEASRYDAEKKHLVHS